MMAAAFGLVVAVDWFVYNESERVFPGPSRGAGEVSGRRIVSGGHRKPGDSELEDFPPGCRVVLPSGATGIVRRWIGVESRRCPSGRLLIVYDGRGGSDGHKAGERVTLSPAYLKRLNNDG